MSVEEARKQLGLPSLQTEEPAVEEPEQSFKQPSGFAYGLGVVDDQGEVRSASEMFKDYTDTSFTHRAGEIIAKEAIGLVNPELKRADTEAQIYERYQKQIWDAQDQLSSLNKKDPQYQIAWENLQDIKKKFVSEMNGEPVEDDMSLGEMFSQVKDVVIDDPAGFTGMMLKQMIADPALIAAPTTWMKAGLALKGAAAAKTSSKAAQETARLSGVAGSSMGMAGVGGATTEVIEQKSQNDLAPITAEEVGSNIVKYSPLGLIPLAIEGAASGAAPALKKANQYAQKQKEIVAKRRLERNKDKIINEAQQEYFKSMDADGNHQITRDVAINRAIAKYDGSEKMADEIQGYLSPEVMAMRKPQLEQDSKSLVKKGVDKAKDGMAFTGKNIAKGWDKLMTPLTTRLMKLGLQNTAANLKRMKERMHTDQHKKELVVEEFKTELDKLNESDRLVLANSLNNPGKFDEVQFNYSPELRIAHGKIRQMLDDEHALAERLGLKVNYIENYFPRYMNYENYAKDKGIDITGFNQRFADALNKKLNLEGSNQLTKSDIEMEMVNRLLGQEEIAKIIAKSVETDQFTKSVGKPAAMKKRTIDEVTPELQQYYADPIDALMNHMTSMNRKIHERIFFGGRRAFSEAEGSPVKESDLVDGYINDYVENLNANRQIEPDKMTEVSDILKAHFIESKKMPWKATTGFKNYMYATTLGQFMSAGTQLGDIPAAIYLNGVAEASSALLDKLAGKNSVSRKEFGLDSILKEIENKGLSKKVMDLSFKGSGFAWVDSLGKDTILSSSYNKMKKWVDPKKISTKEGYEKAYQKFRSRYVDRLGEKQTKQIFEGFIQGDKNNPDVRLALIDDLTRVQPIDMIEMPEFYNRHPNGRIFYMLKSFTLKQIDLLRNDALSKMRRGVKEGNKTMVAEGFMNMGKIAATIGLGNAGVQATKDWIKGNEVNFTDSWFNSILRNYGLDEYTLRYFKKGEGLSAAWDMAKPPVKPLEDIAGAATGRDDFYKGVEAMPIFGGVAKTIRQQQENQGDRRSRRRDNRVRERER